MFQSILDSPVGELQAFASDSHLHGLLFGTSYRPSFAEDAELVKSHRHPIFQQLADQLSEYFNGQRQEFDLALEPLGTEFQLAAWNALTKIPFGETRSYAQQAAVIGRPKAVRAIGAANGKNPISIVVPCHRVIGTNGSLTGFGGGLDVKRFLLEHEAKLAHSGQNYFSYR